MSNHYIKLQSKTGIYTATCIPNLKEKVEAYINAVDEAFPLLKSSFGLQPQINEFSVKFIPDGGYYAGGGRIFLSNDEPNLNRESPACYDGGLVFETIHGFLEPLRHPPHGIDKPTVGKNRLDESFSTIIEIDFLNNVGASDAACRHRIGEGMGKPHHPLLLALVEIYDLHKINAFHKFFSYVDKESKSRLPLNAIKYGQDEKTPYIRSYMSKLGEIFKESAGIDVTDILIKYAAPNYGG